MEHKHHVDHVKQEHDSGGHAHHADHVKKHAAGHTPHTDHIKKMCGGGYMKGKK